MHQKTPSSGLLYFIVCLMCYSVLFVCTKLKTPSSKLLYFTVCLMHYNVLFLCTTIEDTLSGSVVLYCMSYAHNNN